MSGPTPAFNLRRSRAELWRRPSAFNEAAADRRRSLVASRGSLWSAIVMVTLTIACARSADAPAKPTIQKQLTFSILEDYDKGQSLDEVAADFDLFAELGITTWRGSFGWDDYEPTRGHYDFAWLHRFATLAAERGITLRPYIGYTPAWASAGGSDRDVWNDSPKDLEAWSRFLRTLAGEMRQHTNLVSYEIYNEENVKQWWDGTAMSYRDVLHRAADAIHMGNPNARVLLGGMVFPDTDWIEAVCDRQDGEPGIDVIPFHAYPETWTPQGVTVETYLGATFESDFVATADATCGRKPVWINETGYATSPGRTEQDQANWWLRAAATFAAEPRIEHIGVYEIKDAPRDKPVIGDAPNYYLGLSDVNRRKKAAFGTVKRLVAMLGHQPFAPAVPPVTMKRAANSAQVYAHLFTRNDGRRFLFVWTENGDAIVDVEIGSDAKTAIEYALGGRADRTVALRDRRLHDVELHRGVVRYFEIAD